MSSNWPRITDLITSEGPADVALLGAPMERASVNPARYDLAPRAVRDALARFGTYDVETGREIAVRIRDAGDVAVQGVTPEDGFVPIRDAAAALVAKHGITLLLGGHNGVTRPAVHALGVPLEAVGLITLDAHFDLRDTQSGLMNGNPVRALLEDGLPGQNIVQVGLAPFANSRAMHDIARATGIGVHGVDEVKRRGISAVLDGALPHLAHCDVLMVDFDIDVIDRAQCPGASGARPGGISADMFFAAARRLAAEPRVRLVDLTEFDPGRDVGEVTLLTAGRWVCEILAGYEARP